VNLFGYTTKEVIVGVVLSTFLSAIVFWGGLHFYMMRKAESNQTQQHNYVVRKEMIDEDLYIYTVKEKATEKTLKIIRDTKHDTTEIVK
jgi:hypothetical protein